MRLFRIIFFSLTLCLTVICQKAQAAFNWETITQDGCTYVPVSSIRAFYGLTAPPKKEDNSYIISNKKAQIKIRDRSQDMYMNGLKFILSHPTIENNGQLYISRIDVAKIIEPILRPTYIKSAGNFNTVIIDPGHGGHDAGAVRHLIREADINLRLAKMLKPLLEKRNFRVVLTRSSNKFLTLQERVQIANAYKNAIFISIHFNSGNSDAAGIETFTLAPRGTASSYSRSLGNTSPLTGNMQDSANIALATAIQGTVQRKLGAIDRGIKRARFSVLCNIEHPAILFEGGFVSHPKESQLITNEKYLSKMASLLTDAVSKYQVAVRK